MKDTLTFNRLALTVTLAVLLCSIQKAIAQTSAINESQVILSINNGSNVYYDLQAATASADFVGTNLGTFTPTQSINVSGAKQKTQKCGGCSISASTLYYRVYEVYSLPGIFNAVNIPLLSNDTGGCGGNQTWRLTNNTTNILSGLNSGTYYLEVYTTATFSSCGTGSNVANNNGLNYKAIFTVNGVIAQYAGATTVATTTANGTINTPVTVSSGSITNLCTSPLNIMRTTVGAFNQATATNYIEFMVKPQPGYQFTVTGIKINARKAAGGPKNGRIDYNPNNTGFIGGVNYLTSVTSINCTSTVPQQPANVTGVTITDTVNGLVVRAYFWTNTNATTGVLDFSNLIVEGIVSELPGPPKVALPVVSTISTNSAVLGATIISSPGSAVTSRGTVFSTSPNVTASDNPLAEGGSNIGAFSHSRAGLNAQTLYYYAGYATNGFGTNLSTTSSFRTRSKTPLTQATNLTAAPVSYSTINLNWATATFPTSGANRFGYLIIYATGIPSLISVPGGLPPSSIIANGTIGAIIDSAAPSLPQTSININGLIGNTLYNFLVIPFTWNGVNTNTYSYLIAGSPSVSAATLPTNYQWIGSGISSWSTPTNWQPNGVPANSDAIAFNNTGTVTVTNVPDAQLTSITVSGNSNVSLAAPASGGNSIFILNNAGEALSIDQGSTLSLLGNGPNNMTITFSGIGNNATINGTLNLLKAASGIGVGNYNASNSNTNVNGLLVRESTSLITSNANNLNFNSGGSFRLTGTGLSIPTATWQPGSTCEIAVTYGGTLTGLEQTFSNFIVNCPALSNSLQCNGALININDTFNLINTNLSAGKTFALTNTTPYILNLNGDLMINNNACLDITNGSPVTTGVPTINLKGSITITGTGLLEQSGSAEAFLNLVKPSGDQLISLASINSFSQAEFSATINIGNSNTANRVKFNSNVSLGNFYISSINVNSGATLDFGSYVLSGLGGNINVMQGAILRIGNANGISAVANTGNVQLTGTRIFDPGAIYTYSGNVNQFTGDGLPVNVNSIIIENTGFVGNNTVALSIADSAAFLTLKSGLFNPNGKIQTIKMNGILNADGGNFSSSATGSVAFSNGSVTGIVDFYAGVRIKGAVNFGSGSTVYSSLQIDNGGYIVANAPVYAVGSILKYNSGTVYSRGLEWSSTSGAGYPANVQIRNNTNLDLSANGWNNRSCSGYLDIALGCALSMGAMTNSLTVGKQLVLDGTLLLATANGGDIYVGGNWTRNTTGVFTPNNRTVFFNGSNSSNINGTATDASFDYLVMNKAAGASVTIAKDVTVNKSLTFISGNINTGAYKVIIPQTALINRTAGHVNGNLQKYFISGGPITQFFEIGDANIYSPVSVRLAIVSITGNLIVSARQGDHPSITATVLDGAKTINRYWSINNSGISFTSCNPIFYFESGDKEAGVITDSLICAKLDNSVWTYPTMSTRTTNSAKLLNVTSLGDFQLGIRCTSPTLTSSVTNVSCRNGNNGTINLNVAGGSPPFSYSWSNGATTQNLTNCSAGNYSVTVIGQGECSKVSNITITQPAAGITASAGSNTPQCAGSTINLIANASGGTGVLNYNWTGPNGFTSTISNGTIINAGANASGVYQLTVSDANNCSASGSTSVTVNAVSPAITGSPTFCAGSSTSLNVGSFPSYFWSTGATTSSISVNSSNTYTVTVTSANGCTGSSTIIATALPVLTPTISISSNTGVNICSGTPVTFNAAINNGGIAPVYKWKKNGVIVGINSSTYTDTALITGDIIKCSLSCQCATSNPVTSAGFTFSVSQPVVVNAGDGPIEVCGTGAISVYGKINNATTGYNGIWSTTSGMGTFSNTAWNGVNGVTYTASVNDAGKTIYLVLNGPVSGSCAGLKDSVAVNVLPGVAISPGFVNAVCKGSSSFDIPFSSASGYPVEYTLLASGPNPMPGFVNQISQPLGANVIQGLIPASVSAGNYSFSFQVANPPCQSDLYSFQMTVNPNPAISASSSAANICLGNATTLSSAGGSGYVWMPGFLDGANVVVTPASATTYTVTGTNAFGCSSIATIMIGVNPLPVPLISGNNNFCFGGNTVLNAGSGFNSYLWSTGSTSQNITVNSSNTYTVTVTNANNCSASVSKQVLALPPITVTASANVDSIQAGANVQLNSNAAGSVSGIYYTVASATFSPLSASATKVVLGDDQMSGALPIGFSFIFYGNTYNNFYISSNGFITFNAGSNDGCCQGPPIPNNNNGNVSNMISLAWNDLNAAGGTVDYFTTGTVPNRKLVVRYNIAHINGDPVIAQAILFEGTNFVEIHATTIPNMLYADASYISTMGVQNDGGTVATTVPGRNGAGWSASNDAWRFIPFASYNYTWAPPAGLSNAAINNPVAIPLSSTNYTVTATAYNGCTGTATRFIYVDQPTTLTVFSTASAINCSGSSSIVSINALGGVQPYSGVGNFTVSAGTYTYTVTDALGQTASTTITVNQPPALVATFTLTPIACNGGNSIVTVGATGGTPPYSGIGTFNLFAGNYTYTVTDSKGCTAIVSGLIVEPTVLSATSSATPINCWGSSSTVTIAATGGTLPYTGAGNFIVQAGTYTYTVTDSKGCSTTTETIITQPQALQANSYGYTTVCYQDSATITVIASGGTSPYYGPGNYRVSAGIYNYLVSDSKGCTAVTNIAVTELPQLISTPTLLQNISCFGKTDGKISVVGSNGASPYIYLWNDGTTNKSLAALTAGTYSVTISDNNGCSISEAYTLTQPDDVTVTGNTSNITCNGLNDGEISISVAGGTLPYNYIWVNGVTANSINALTAANYKVTVTDNNGCVATNTFAVTQPAVLSSTGSNTNINCFGGSNATAIVTPSGGIIPYSYLWSNGATVANLTNIVANDYTVTVTDANGCSLSRSYIVTEPSLVTVVNTQVDLACFGDIDGKATAFPSGGSGYYSYLWSNGVTTKTAYSLVVGAYTVTVTDTKGCTVTTSSVLAQPPLLSLSGLVTNVNCNGAVTGAINISASGGAGGNTYLWNNGVTNASQSGIGAGYYAVTVTDANGCKANFSNTLTQPSILSTTLASTNISCNGSGNGNANISASGATPPYNYLWSNSSTNSSINNLLPGTFTVSVIDAKGCVSVKSTVITQPALLVNSLSKVDILCNGLSNASATSNPTGGTSPYSYLWNSGTTTKTQSGIPTGTYTVTVTDNKGCTKVTNTTITQPAVLTYSFTTENVTCFGSNNGNAAVMPSGGVAPYSYLWNTGSTTSGIISLAPISYTVTMTDYNGCDKVRTFVISEPPLLTVSNANEHLSCNGAGDGKATSNPVGGTNPYSYLWSSGDLTKVNSGLTAATYTVTVTDNKGCTKTASSIITQPVALNVNTVITNVSCNNGNNGAVVNTVTGGVIPYSYLWNGSNTTQSRTGLTAGNYTVTVTDANGCTSKITNSVTQPALLSVIGSGNNITCYGAANGNASAASSGGTIPYTYLWNTAAAASTLNNLTPANYTVTVTDLKGCTASKTYSITQPASLALSIATTNSTCNGANNGSVTANPTGGNSGYSYLWSIGNTAKTLNNLSTGSYTVTVTDLKGCVTLLNTLVTEPAPLSFITNQLKNVSCFGGVNGKIDISITGGNTSYTQLWSNGATTKVINFLTAGVYTLSVTDNKGCSKAQSYSVNSPSQLAVAITKTNPSAGNNNGTATANPSGATAPYTYSWSTTPVKTSATVTALAPGTYTVTVTDFNGCTQSNSVTLIASRMADGSANDNELFIQAMPNPANGAFTLKISSQTDGYAEIFLTDATLRLVHKERIQLNIGMNERYIDSSSFAKGLYLLKVTTANKSEVIQIIIQ